MTGGDHPVGIDRSDVAVDHRARERLLFSGPFRGPDVDDQLIPWRALYILRQGLTRADHQGLRGENIEHRAAVADLAHP